MKKGLRHNDDNIDLLNRRLKQ